MRGLVDLHCHYLPNVDDGVRSEDDGVALLRALASVGFEHVVATPHMRPALWDNGAAMLRDAYASMRARLDREIESSTAEGAHGLPTTSLAAEHFFDEKIYAALMDGQGLPYGVGRAVLVEFSNEQLPVALAARFYDLRRKRLRPVVAHPERYEPFWRKPAEAAVTMRRAGGVLLLDVGALDGKYGSKAQRTAEALVDDDAYYAACSDAHREDDVGPVSRGIEKLRARVGDEGADLLLRVRPRSILEGKILDAYD